MKLNLTNSIQITGVTFLISLVISALLLSAIRPSCFMILDYKSKKYRYSYLLVSSYSFIFALVTSIIALMLSSKKYSSTPIYADSHLYT